MSGSKVCHLLLLWVSPVNVHAANVLPRERPEFAGVSAEDRESGWNSADRVV